MTVAELIKVLETMPAEAGVFVANELSSYLPLEPAQIMSTYVRPSDYGEGLYDEADSTWPGAQKAVLF